MNLREICAQDRELWDRVHRAGGSFFRDGWARAEWQSYGSLLTHAAGRLLGQRVGVGEPIDLRVLEIGFGIGRGLHNLIDYLGIQQEGVVGIELFEDHVNEASRRWPRARFETIGPEAKDAVAWLYRERQAGAAYDLVVMRHVLQYNDPPEPLLQAVAGVMPEGRILAVVVPKGISLYETAAPLAKRGLDWIGVPDERPTTQGSPADGVGAHCKVHAFGWVGDNWGPVLMECGFTVVEVGHNTLHRGIQVEESYAFCRRNP